MTALWGLPMEKVNVKVAQSCPTLCDPVDYTVNGILQARILGWVAFPFSRESFQPKDRTQVSCIAADSLPAEPQGEPKNTGAGGLSFLQQIFLTQESNRGLLHCGQILNQLSSEGSPPMERFQLNSTASCVSPAETGGALACLPSFSSFSPLALFCSVLYIQHFQAPQITWLPGNLD